MKNLRRTAMLVTLAGLALLVVISGGAGFQAAPLRADSPFVIGTIGVGSGNASNGPEGVAIDPTRNRIFVSNSRDNTVYVINGVTNQVTGITNSSILTPWGAAYNPINDKVYVASNSRNSVVVINAGTLAVEQEIFDSSLNLPDQVTVDAINNLIYVTNSAGGMITVINGANNTVATRFSGIVAAPHSIALDQSRNRAYVTNLYFIPGSGPEFMLVFSTISYTEIGRRGALAGPNGLAIRSVDGTIYTGQYFSDNGQWRVAVISPLNLGFVVPFPGLLIGGRNPMGMAYSAGSDRVYVNGYGSNTVDVIDASNNTLIATLPVGANPASGIAVNPNTGKVYVANRGSGSVTIIQDAPTAPTATATPVNTPTATPTPLCFPDGYEPDNIPAKAQVINTAGLPQNHNICPNGDQDYTKFFVPGPQTLTLETKHLTGGTDTVLYLYEPDGTTLLAFNDDKGVAVPGPKESLNSDKAGLSADETASRIVYSFTKAGWYIARVKDFNPDAFGTTRRYDMTVSGGAPYAKGIWLPVIISNY